MTWIQHDGYQSKIVNGLVFKREGRRFFAPDGSQHGSLTDAWVSTLPRHEFKRGDRRYDGRYVGTRDGVEWVALEGDGYEDMCRRFDEGAS